MQDGQCGPKLTNSGIVQLYETVKLSIAASTGLRQIRHQVSEWILGCCTKCNDVQSVLRYGETHRTCDLQEVTPRGTISPDSEQDPPNPPQRLGRENDKENYFFLTIAHSVVLEPISLEKARGSKQAMRNCSRQSRTAKAGGN
jgi:hypothetical protein